MKSQHLCIRCIPSARSELVDHEKMRSSEWSCLVDVGVLSSCWWFDMVGLVPEGHPTRQNLVRLFPQLLFSRALQTLSTPTYTITLCNQPTRLTQPCIPLGSLNRYQLRLG